MIKKAYDMIYVCTLLVAYGPFARELGRVRERTETTPGDPGYLQLDFHQLNTNITPVNMHAVEYFQTHTVGPMIGNI